MATVRIGGRAYDVTVRGNSVVVDGIEFPVSVRDDGVYATVTAGGVAYRVSLPPEGDRTGEFGVEVDYRPMTIAIEGVLAGRQPAARLAAAQPRSTGGGTATPGGVAAQIAGRITSIKVKAGDAVAAGDVLLLLEAMKMENEIKAPSAGVVREVLVREGARVAEGDVLVVVTAE